MSEKKEKTLQDFYKEDADKYAEMAKQANDEGKILVVGKDNKGNPCLSIEDRPKEELDPKELIIQEEAKITPRLMREALYGDKEEKSAAEEKIKSVHETIKELRKKISKEN